MINLTTLSALLRTLRYSGGPDGPVAPVSRVPPVVSLTPDDSSAATASALRVAAWSRSAVPEMPLLDAERAAHPAVRRDAGMRARDLPAVGAAPSLPQLAAITLLAKSDIDSTALDFTAGARLLQVAMRGSAGTVPLPPAVETRLPLVDNDRPATTELARGLARSVVESGLFYESHLARWVRRDYPAAALLREPQSAWLASPGDPVSAMSVAPASTGVASEAMTQLLARQLDALDTRALVWSGELWPGQRASVAFEENQATSDDEPDAAATTSGSGWRTRVVLELAALGRVEATLVMRGNTLDLMLEAEHPEARARLMHAHESLTASLAGAHLTLGNFAVAFGTQE